MTNRRVLAPLLAAATLLALVASLACGDDMSEATGTPKVLAVPGGAVAVDDPFSGGYPTFDDPATGLRIVFGTPDLGPGASRVSLALFDDVGVISEPTLRAVTRHYPDGAEAAFAEVEEADLVFRPFPTGGRGIYTGTLTLAEAGLWSLALAVPVDGSIATVVIPFAVAEATEAPAVGSEAPASEHRSAADVDDLHDLTTAGTPDARLYETTIAAARASGMPFVVTFASPAFCTNALCGPQVEVLSKLHDRYASEVAFIHVDLYENPSELQRDFTLARRTPVLREWGIQTDEWTFVVDADGIVRARFEGFAPIEEVEPALLAVLGRE